jgi:16S rRNA (guanine(966)-N(2))-methyltransferase RsmD
VPKLPGLRPTPDRVRETVFNWLGQDLSGRSCLDLFAGTGALGFEAASRGAARVTLVERDRAACEAIERAAARFGADRLEIVRADALQFVARGPARYDVVFLDPPYDQGWIERVEGLLERVLLPDALVYAEGRDRIEQLAGMVPVRHGRAGQVHFHLFHLS